MIEEFYGKISRTGSNISDRLEDKLTGDFFGTLRYLDFPKGLQLILCKALKKSKDYGDASAFDDVIRIIENIKCDYLKDDNNDENNDDNTIMFWPRVKNASGELDVLLKFDNCYIGIEVKLDSGLSSPDQLEREAKILLSHKDDKGKILLFLARHDSCIKVYNEKNDQIPPNVYFVFISWEDVLQSLMEIPEPNVYGQARIKEDLVKLLTRKGFEVFSSMHIPREKLIRKEGYYMCDIKIDDINKKENYTNAAYVVFMTYKKVKELLEAIKKESNASGKRGIDYSLSGDYEYATKGITNDFWVTFQKGNDNSVYAINIFLTDTKEENPSAPIFRILRYDSIQKKVNGNQLAIAFDKNENAKKELRKIKGLHETDVAPYQISVKTSDDYLGLKSIYYVDYSLMDIGQKDVEKVFCIFDELSKLS